MYGEPWKKIKNITSTSNSSENQDEIYIKIKIGSDDDLPLKKTLELCDMIVARSVFIYDSTYYPQVILDVCLYKVAG